MQFMSKEWRHIRVDNFPFVSQKSEMDASVVVCSVKQQRDPLWWSSWWWQSDIHGNWSWSLLNFSVTAAPRHAVHATPSWRNQIHNLVSRVPTGHQHEQSKLPISMWHVRKMSTNQQNILIASTLCPCPYPGAAPKRSISWDLFPLLPLHLKLSFNYICNTGSSEI